MERTPNAKAMIHFLKISANILFFFKKSKQKHNKKTYILKKNSKCKLLFTKSPLFATDSAVTEGAADGGDGSPTARSRRHKTVTEGGADGGDGSPTARSRRHKTVTEGGANGGDNNLTIITEHSYWKHYAYRGTKSAN